MRVGKNTCMCRLPLNMKSDDWNVVNMQRVTFTGIQVIGELCSYWKVVVVTTSRNEQGRGWKTHEKLNGQIATANAVYINHIQKKSEKHNFSPEIHLYLF